MYTFMSLNKKVLIIALLMSVVMMIFRSSENLAICSGSEYQCLVMADKIEHILYVFPVVLFFATVALLTKEHVFLAWWKFARIAVPVVLLISILISLKSPTGTTGWFSFEKELNLAIISITHLVFILGSAIQIYRGYRQGE